MSLTPRLIPSLVGRKVIALACGAAHTLALVLTDTQREARRASVYSWGLGRQGQIGHGEGTSSEVPKEIAELVACGVNGCALACGLAHSVVLDDSGDLWVFGWNNVGQLGVGTTNDVLLPTVVNRFLGGGESPTPMSSVAHVAAGGGHTVAIDDQGRAYATGSNSCGQLGVGDDRDR